ncbi:Relaxase/Mobilisation nuclease domain-containing protein [Arachidicoccus rhizosphaerae]|uniref:Relaxase/Mobilisation nuclease domain-containing protein n=1 Tax=Arachidicoccus rhizosphaerae TaxID=551991 RepID=A0A1H4B017_9BACT|nr:relaxase/mobilization nuclease domain-containing protein [Arachidicoccus rhizosphaerae]SEA41469.1 Relaxase/Mobilisation nuclease domain-containing protein [Arachidicoccus rhizosphaerae]
MVIKILRSSSPSNLISYLLGPGSSGDDSRAKIVTGNYLDLEGTKDELATGFAAYAGGSKLKHPCFHCIVSLPPGEALTESQAHELIQDIENTLKMEHYPYLAVQHVEKSHNHYHLAIGRHSPLHNKVLHDPFSYRILTKLAREKERQWGLKQLPDPFKKEAFVRSDQRKASIRAKVIESLTKADNYDDFVRELKLHGIDVFKQRGINYSDGAIRVKGSDPCINFSLGKVQAILKSKQEISLQTVSSALPTVIGNSVYEPEGGKGESEATNCLGVLEGLLSGAGQDINQIATAASSGRRSDEEDEEYWKKKKRKQKRLY